MSMYHSPDLKRYGQTKQYLVNNSFHCGLQPKRVSNDVHLYMLYHKKMLRKAVIDKRYEDNLNSFQNSPQPLKPGFKGSTTRHHFSHTRYNNQKEQKDFRIKKKATTCHFQIDDHSKNKIVEQRKLWIPNQNASVRPNMMYNLTLYRRSFRENEVKSNSICIKIVEDYKKMMDDSSDGQMERRRRVKTLM